MPLADRLIWSNWSVSFVWFVWFIWSIWFILLVWFNQINKTNQITFFVCFGLVTGRESVVESHASQGEPVAQLVEHRPFKARVPGSSPGRLTIKNQ